MISKAFLLILFVLESKSYHLVEEEDPRDKLCSCGIEDEADYEKSEDFKEGLMTMMENDRDRYYEYMPYLMASDLKEIWCSCHLYEGPRVKREALESTKQILPMSGDFILEFLQQHNLNKATLFLNLKQGKCSFFSLI